MSRERLKQAMMTDDNIGALIRCHFEAERCARYTLSKLTSGRSDAIDYRYLSNILDSLLLIGLPQIYVAVANNQQAPH
jgi:hypothetical protein